MMSILALAAFGLLGIVVAIVYGVLKIINSSASAKEDYRRSPAWDETREFGDLHYAQIGEER
jgi:hypothetical protein